MASGGGAAWCFKRTLGRAGFLRRLLPSCYLAAAD